MNDDELKRLWREQPLRNPPSAAQVIAAVQRQTTQLRRCLEARDWRELIVSAVLIVVFGVFYFTVYLDPISRLGDLIIIGSLIFIGWKIIHTRRSNPPAAPGATTVETLRAELNSVRAQSRLLHSIHWWYLLPLGIGLFVCTWGNPGGGFGMKIGYSLFVFGLFAFIYWLNQRAREQQLLPIEAQLQSLLHAAETGEPLDERLSDRRLIALSMADADRLKRAEFKVGFWHIALFGEIGFIGIWFFLMLSRPLENESWNTTAPPPEMVARSVPGETAERYSSVARNVTELLNSGDYRAVQRLYNPSMSQAFPPTETIDFYTKLADRFGKIQAVQGPVENGYRGWIAYRLRCERGELTMSLALDAENRISGIHFGPTPGPSLTPALVVRRIGSWQRLAWLVPFFLAGLVYSWIIQKTTERAVGISTLGIHLAKGQTVVLWDEIKEVRPFRLLHLRSLWLIKESGQKTLIPWTSLERHTDLKASVEASAPASHAIRRYTSLLS